MDNPQKVFSALKEVLDEKLKEGFSSVFEDQAQNNASSGRKDTVSREEFEVQQKILLKNRNIIESLELQIQALKEELENLKNKE